MRALLFTLLLFSSSFLAAADRTFTFMFMPAHWYGYHWEETPDGLAKASKRQTILTAAVRFPYGLSLGGSWLQNTSYAQDSHITLSAQGLSVGFVGAGYLSAFYTFLYKPRLDYEFPSLDASTSYYGGSGSITDIGLHFGSNWFRFGPRVLLIDVDYRKSSVRAGPEIEAYTLEDKPWRDRWLEPYLGLWLLF